MASKKSGTPKKRSAKKRRSGTAKKKSHAGATARGDALSSFPDPRAMEKTMRSLHRLLNAQEFDSVEEANAFLQQFVGVKDLPSPSSDLSPLERAQDKMYEAWEATTEERREQLAREALSLSADCADAYVLLAEETAQTPEETREFYEQGVQAGARALGPEAFAEDVGDFWGILETRPYMRARAGLAECLAEMGERRQAIGHYQELLRLNPNDNQGNRYLLTHLLLQEGDDEALEKLLEQYKDDASAEWRYTRALWKFRREGASAKASAALQEAFAQNRFVPLYFMGLKEPPTEPPAYMSFGDENEAVSYFVNAAEEWLDTPDALEWMASVMLAEVEKMVALESQKKSRKKLPRK